MFIYRDEYYNREDSEQKGIAELIVAKHRNGATGVARPSAVPFATSTRSSPHLARGEA